MNSLSSDILVTEKNEQGSKIFLVKECSHRKIHCR